MLPLVSNASTHANCSVHLSDIAMNCSEVTKEADNH